MRRWAPRLSIVVLLLGGVSLAGEAAQGWITHPDAPATPVVLEFRRELTLAAVPRVYPVTVTADNRFILFVNGRRAASGPSTGTIRSWRRARVDLAPYLVKGANVITATVWNFGELAPAAQQSVATGFQLLGEGIGTDAPGWRVRRVAGHTAISIKPQIPYEYYVASAPEIIDANKPADEWLDAAPAPSAAARTLIDDPLPPQTFEPVVPGRTVRSSLPDAANFPGRPVVIPPHTTAKLLLRRDAMVSAYPELDVAGGRGARIELEYGEALYDEAGHKADRDLVADRELRGFHDTFLPDGEPRTFAPLWWRTFRYAQIEVTTRTEPLTLRALRLYETGYPFQQLASFSSSDAQLDRLWNIGWRTLRVDAHETFMDSSYWEQLQYTGDTRLEMLITYAVSGDARLARQAIEAFAESDVDGLVQGAYPSRLQNVIATFSFAWIGMLSDWRLEQPDQTVIQRHLPRVRRILAWFERYLGDDGLLGKSPHWNFIDWSGQRWDDRDAFPSWGSRNGSCLMTAMWVGALRQSADLERALGDAPLAATHAGKADRGAQAIREHCWDASRGLFADDGDKKVFSQHMNVFAVLYDIAEPSQRMPILDRITVPGQGIDAPPGLYASTYYFAWYLARAFEHAGLADRYVGLLQSWRELLPLNVTTWPETRLQPRSDTHAWSAHPTVDLLRLVAGIRSGCPGYACVRIQPELGALTSLEARAATPRGVVTVRYRVRGDTLQVDIERPADLPGEFVWAGRSHPLQRQRTRLNLRTRRANHRSSAARSRARRAGYRR